MGTSRGKGRGTRARREDADRTKGRVAKEPAPAEGSVERLRLGEVLDFMQRLWAVDQGLHTISKRMLASLGVTGPQRLVIRIVGKFPAIRAGQLAETLHIHPSTLSGVLKRLQRRGLLERRRDSGDRRCALLWLTPKGEEIDRSRKGTVEAVIRRALGKVSAHDLAAARSVLRLVGTDLAAAL